MKENPFRYNPLGLNNPKPIIPDAPKYTEEQLVIRVEIATEKDWEAYKKIRLSALEHNAYESAPKKLAKRLEEERHKSPEKWQKDLRTMNSIVILAWNGSEPVGMARAVRHSKEWWNLQQAYVKEEFQEGAGKKIWGIGRRMFDGRLDAIERRGGSWVTLLVLKNKEDLIRKYERRGFKVVKAIPAMVKTGSFIGTEHYLMEKHLDYSKDGK